MNNNCNYFLTYHRSQKQLTLSNDRCWKVHEFLCSSKGWSKQFRIYITAHASSAKTQILTNRLDATCAGHEKFTSKGQKIGTEISFCWISKRRQKCMNGIWSNVFPTWWKCIHSRLWRNKCVSYIAVWIQVLCRYHRPNKAIRRKIVVLLELMTLKEPTRL